MSRRPALLLVLLALLATLWQPLCFCRAAEVQSSAATSCCATEESAPQPSSPCGEHGGPCECGGDTRLVPFEPANPVSVSLALAYEFPAFSEPALAPRRPRAALRIGRSPAPPGRDRALPLRI